MNIAITVTTASLLIYMVTNHIASISSRSNCINQIVTNILRSPTSWMQSGSIRSFIPEEYSWNLWGSSQQHSPSKINAIKSLTQAGVTMEELGDMADPQYLPTLESWISNESGRSALPEIGAGYLHLAIPREISNTEVLAKGMQMGFSLQQLLTVSPYYLFLVEGICRDKTDVGGILHLVKSQLIDPNIPLTDIFMYNLWRAKERNGWCGEAACERKDDALVKWISRKVIPLEIFLTEKIPQTDFWHLNRDDELYFDGLEFLLELGLVSPETSLEMHKKNAWAPFLRWSSTTDVFPIAPYELNEFLKNPRSPRPTHELTIESLQKLSQPIRESDGSFYESTKYRYEVYIIHLLLELVKNQSSESLESAKWLLDWTLENPIKTSLIGAEGMPIFLQQFLKELRKERKYEYFRFRDSQRFFDNPSSTLSLSLEAQKLLKQTKEKPTDFEILGLSSREKLTKKDIITSYKKRIFWCHPDKIAQRDPFLQQAAEEAFIRLTAAKEALINNVQ